MSLTVAIWRLGWTNLLLGAVLVYWLIYAAWLVAAALGLSLGDDQYRAAISEVATLPISFASAAFAWRTAATPASRVGARAVATDCPGAADVLARQYAVDWPTTLPGYRLFLRRPRCATWRSMP